MRRSYVGIEITTKYRVVEVAAAAVLVSLSISIPIAFVTQVGLGQLPAIAYRQVPSCVRLENIALPDRYVCREAVVCLEQTSTAVVITVRVA